MGLLDRFAQRVAEELQKAPNLPAGATTMSMEQMTAQGGISQGQYGYGTSVALPRNPALAGVPFTPGLPLIPGAINPVRPDGRPDPRRYEYQTAQNINITPTKLVPFTTLRAAADQIDILRRCIEVLKNKVAGLDWDIVLGEDATEKIVAESGADHIRAMAIARQKYTEDINRIKQFWEQPDKANGLVFADWLNIALEEVLVLDAWAVWPQKAVNGDLFGLQILDGSTIKPLIDDRGMRPLAPQPAFQQILYGFPRSEFMAGNETENADGEFTSDELSYMIRNRRSMTVYGYSPVERALSLADIYLRRQQWLRAEYTDGVLPELMFKTDSTFGNNPELLRAYENIFNDDLAGQTQQRKRSRLLPAGMEPVQFEGYGERFKDTLDEYLVTSICGHFGVLPSEIGFAAKTGLGGAGHQEGEANSAENVGLIPLANWFGKMITNMCYTYLGMPRELEFKMMASSRNDTLESAQMIDIEMRSGKRTLNEARTASGLPLLDVPEADMPMLSTGTGLYFLSSEGIISALDSSMGMDLTEDELSAQDETVANPENETPTEDPIEEVTPAEEEVKSASPAEQEVKVFLKWSRKSGRKRQFNFEHIEEDYAKMLNKFVAVGDRDSARWYAQMYLGQ